MSKKEESVDIWILLDGNYYVARNYFPLASKEYRFIETSVCYNFLRQIQELRDFYSTDNIIVCFDCGEGVRGMVYPDYKMNRQEADENKRTRMRIMRVVRDVVLPEAGIQVFYQLGYEADDVIASLCNTIPKQDEIVIASNDKDLYQLLSNRVSIHKPHSNKIYGKGSFVKEFGCSPESWAMVKAIAGCPTDNVKGIRGIGEKTAAKFCAGHLDSSSKYFKLIVENTELWTANLKLVELPYEGTKKFKVKRQAFDERQFKKTKMKFGVL